MKIIYLITAVFLLILTGCSSTYKVSDFSSKDKFYEDFNKSANHKTIKIGLTNDSSFFATKGAEISNDSLFYSNQVQKERKIIFKSELKSIRYSFNSYNSTYSAAIILNTGERLNVDNIELLPDSSVCWLVDKYESLPLKKIKYISYKNNLLGGILGFVYSIPFAIVGGELLSLTVPPTGRGGAGSTDLTNAYLTGPYKSDC